jgi:hypothetical protein
LTSIYIEEAKTFEENAAGSLLQTRTGGPGKPEMA